MIKTHRQILELWPNDDVVAIDLGDKPATVKQWRYRDRIPADRWVGLVAAAQERDIPLTYKMLAEAAAA